MQGNPFSKMMPHKVRVYSATYNKQGQKVPDPSTDREYQCLITDSETITRDQQGTLVTFNSAAYIWAVPYNSNDPVNIKDSETVEIVEPAHEERPVQQIQRYYWITGNLYCMTVGFK